VKELFNRDQAEQFIIGCGVDEDMARRYISTAIDAGHFTVPGSRLTITFRKDPDGRPPENGVFTVTGFRR
jgi:hypothetical protein